MCEARRRGEGEALITPAMFIFVVHARARAPFKGLRIRADTRYVECCGVRTKEEEEEEEEEEVWVCVRGPALPRTEAGCGRD